MRPTRHLFLTGDVQSGKSTLIDCLLAMHPQWRTGGFRTVTAPPADSQGSRPVYILPAGRPDAARGPRNLVGIRHGTGQRTALPEGFEEAGVEILSLSGQADLILMDEVGTMENDAPAFQEKLLGVLDGGIPVLGVLKKKSTPFLRAVISRPDVRVIRVSLDTFDASLALANSLLCEIMENRG